jgi:hypothetical protein
MLIRDRAAAQMHGPAIGVSDAVDQRRAMVWMNDRPRYVAGRSVRK